MHPLFYPLLVLISIGIWPVPGHAWEDGPELRRLCGVKLKHTILKLCNNQLDWDKLAVNNNPPIAEDSGLDDGSRQEGDIAYQCCYQRCSLQYLLSLCANQRARSPHEPRMDQ